MSELPPALAVPKESWRCVQGHDKEGWLSLMAEDICMEDPIGQALTNPTGTGVKGKDGVSDFYDKHIADANIAITVHESWWADKESAHLMTLETTLSNGVRSKVTSIFTYRLNDEGKLTNLRGYWKMSDMSFEQPDA